MVLGLGRRRRAAAGRREDRKKNWLRPNTGDAKKRFSKKVAPADPKKTPMKDRLKVFTEAELAKLDPYRDVGKPLKQQAVATKRWDDGSKKTDSHISKRALMELANGHAQGGKRGLQCHFNLRI